MRALGPALCALLLASGCPSEDAPPAEAADELAVPQPTDGDGARGRGPGADPNAWPGQRAEPPSNGGGAPQVVVARGDSRNATAAQLPDEPPPPAVDCERVVDHIYEVMRQQAPARPSTEAREREADDRAALARMCPPRATAAYEACVLGQRTIDGILRCDPISGATEGKAHALIEQARERVELPDPADPKPLPKPLELPDPVLPH